MCHVFSSPSPGQQAAFSVLTHIDSYLLSEQPPLLSERKQWASLLAL
jgi:hypothetical protein